MCGVRSAFRKLKYFLNLEIFELTFSKKLFIRYFKKKKKKKKNRQKKKKKKKNATKKIHDQKKNKMHDKKKQRVFPLFFYRPLFSSLFVVQSHAASRIRKAIRQLSLWDKEDMISLGCDRRPKFSRPGQFEFQNARPARSS